MFLSIITITFNNLKGMKETAESVISQSFKDFEWIVVDGGSSDGTKEYLESISEHIDWWCSETDKGIYNAMNKGIRTAKGKYCFFLNSGDYLIDCDSLQRAMDCNIVEDIVWGYIKCKKGNSLFDGKRRNHVTLKTFVGETINHSGNAFIRRELFDEKYYGLYDENLKIVSDWKWFLQTLGLGDVTGRFIDVCMSVYDMNGISETQMELNLTERNLVLHDLLDERILSDYDEMKTDCVLSIKSAKQLSALSIGLLIKAVVYKMIKPFLHNTK